MKFLFANKFFFMRGGAERVFFQERNFLLDRGFEVVDFSMDHPDNYHSDFSSFFVSNIDYHGRMGIGEKIRQAVKFINSREAAKKLEELILREKPDIAHLHNIYHQLTPSIIHVLKKHGVKVVLTLHDGKLLCPSYLFLDREKICEECAGRHFWKPLARRCQGSFAKEFLFMVEAYWHKWKKSYGKVDLFISPSRFLADLTKSAMPEYAIRVLRNGVDANEYSPSCRDDGYGLYFGRLAKEKGIETLVKAHKLTGFAMPLKIVGTGPTEDRLRRESAGAEFLGFKQGAELNELIERAGFVVVPSEWYENCSMVVLEAMAMGKSVIGSRVGGIPEQIVDGKTGFLFEMGNAEQLAGKMLTLLGNPGMRQDFGRVARKKLESDYSLENHCSELLKIYENLATGK